ncbi:MAG: peptide deformylase [Eubacteriales bacterium]|nr:peptide deformylase [Eubacteriales bacterium]
MALLNIIKEDKDVLNALRKKSRTVEEITPRINTLIDDMKETLKVSGGIGLAAPQVGILRRVVIVDDGEEILELINPEIISAEGEQDGIEACLSLPGKWGMVKRPLNVTVKALDRTGEVRTYTGTGLVGRCFCHEIDHLNGILYTDLASRMLDPDELE